MKKSFWTMALVTVLASSASLTGQENAVQVEIVDGNGENVGAAQILVGAQDKEDAVQIGQQLRIEGDKIIITDENGETREIDISGARSVSVQQALKSVDDNGDQKTVMHGKAIIIGPDGKKQVIELGAPLGEDENNGVRLLFGADAPDGLFVGDEPMALRFFRNQNLGENSEHGISKFMIGIQCVPVSEQLRAQLDLETGVGLIIQSVSEESPAAEGGILVHDILMSADDTELRVVADLSKIVDQSGQEKKPFSLTAIRTGNEIDLSITPIERPTDQFFKGDIIFGHPDMKMELRQFGPGIIVGDVDVELPDEMQEQMNEIRDRMKQMELEMKIRLMDRIQDRRLDPDNDNEEENDEDNQ